MGIFLGIAGGILAVRWKPLEPMLPPLGGTETAMQPEYAPPSLSLASSLQGEIDIDAELAAVPGGGLSNYRRSQAKWLLKGILTGLLFGIVGVVLVALAFIPIPLLNILLGLAGLGFILSFPIIVALFLKSSLRGGRLRTPEQTVKTFYSYGVLNFFWSNPERAWICLTPKAQHEFATVQAFKDHWKGLLKALEENVKGSNPEVKNIKILQQDDCRCIVAFDFVAKEPKILVMRSSGLKIPYGGVAYAQRRALVKSNNKWLFTCGTVDLPANVRVRTASQKPLKQLT